ncbi:group III truncated hemoglobin [Lewinella sp. JB7]|uniref:group III truncated hemoglobin n=1 Tax=Lewinella sp. JB7 TaxID=2962887 RepID=UPI0020C98A19|nr:group III truncated hemoglobin [Lewinella sp. JB7]MCP9236181.1 group III truncated hemoglobin [Lewinella sp. JB7]
MEPRDISCFDDIKALVDSFYGKVREDTLLGPVFGGVIRDRWPDHLGKMYRFWQTVLLGERTYGGSPFLPHLKLPVSSEHFDRWKQLFHRTVDEHFRGPKADEAKWRADRMAEMFEFKIDHYRRGHKEPLI